MTKHLPSQQNSQSGITLMLAVLILAALTAIAFSLATIITIEIRSSGDVLRTEPALYAVQGVTEEAFFKYKRFVGDTALDVATGDTASDSTGCSPSSLNVCSINGVSLNSPVPAVRQYDPAPRADVVPTNTTQRYLFIDPAQPNDFGRAYSSISVTLLNNVTGGTAMFIKCCNPDGSTSTVQTTTLTPNTAVTRAISDNGQYELAVQNAGTTPLLVQIDAIKTTAVNGQTHLIPLLNKTMDVRASYLGLTRIYTIKIPQP